MPNCNLSPLPEWLVMLAVMALYGAFMLLVGVNCEKSSNLDSHNQLWAAIQTEGAPTAVTPRVHVLTTKL